MKRCILDLDGIACAEIELMLCGEKKLADVITSNGIQDCSCHRCAQDLKYNAKDAINWALAMNKREAASLKAEE